MAQTTDVVVVTGAARGIGAVIAGAFAHSGATVVGFDAVAEAATSGGDGPPASLIEVDVADPDAVDQAVATAATRYGRIDVLVNNAGVNCRSSAESTTDAEWDRTLAVNLDGAFWMSRAAFPYLVASRGRIVNVCSTAGLKAIKNTLAYGVSKAALIHLTRVLALEWASEGIRVNAVAPTIVPSPMTAEVIADEAYMTQKLSTIPLGRTVTASEVADAVLFLASNESGMITGQTLPIDGGVTIT